MPNSQCKLSIVMLSMITLYACVGVPSNRNDSVEAKPTLVAGYGDWRVYQIERDGNQVCYISSRATKTKGEVKKRGTPDLLVTAQPPPTSSIEISLQPGYEYLEGSVVEVSVGQKAFTMFSRGKFAWTSDDYDDRKMIEAFREFDEVVAKGVSSSNTTTEDSYSLVGFGDAYEALLAGCSSSKVAQEEDVIVEKTAPTSPDRKRVALVIGNGSYKRPDDQLKNAVNDAKSIARELRRLNIDVIEAIDVDYRGMRDVLRVFDRALQDADVGILYYAGHAMEYQGENYLFPTDAVLETEGDIGLGLIEMDQILNVMETTVPTRLVFLDACRNNPLARRFRSSLAASRSNSIGRGLAQVNASAGTFIAYATAPGEVAADGLGQNSPFTTAMLRHIREPGIGISELMRKVRNSVIEATNNKQIPWESSSLRLPFIFNFGDKSRRQSNSASILLEENATIT